ncbi:MAG TPA: helix-turn-helix domain-containing protein [Kineosporiaceae bacterium]|nr:helix-turn-helix domain-containing protein [Kineosporiaceae bacterium]
MTDETKVRPRLRADARRNQEQLLAAARDVLVERGTGAPLEEVARRAGVGIATLYRRFPDRTALLRAVVLDALERTSAAAEEALDAAGDGLGALVRYLHAALDVRVSAVIPLVLDRLDLEDPDLGPARERSAALVQRLVDAAHADGTLAADVTFADVGTLLVRLARPLPGLPRDVDGRLAHRHLDLLVAGLRPVPGREPPGGPQLDRVGLRALRAADVSSGADERG